MGTKVLGTTDNGGEADVNSQYEDKGGIAGAGRRHRDGTININALLRGAGAALAATVVAVTVVAAMALAPAEAHAQERIALASPVRTAMVTVTLGKSQDVHTDASLADIVVGDPSVADVNPLTDRSLSILGKKIGTTRVTVYDQNKKPVGIFDVEVSYDISLLSGEIRQFTGGGIKVSSINGRIMLSGTAPDAATLDKAVMIARQFVPDVNSVINTVQVMQQQQVMLEVRFMEVNRQASRELGVQWSGSNTTGNGSGQVTVGTGGLLSGSTPFGVLVGTLASGNTSLNATLSALEQRGLARSLAEPNLVALSGDTASFLAGGTFYIPTASSTGTPQANPVNYGVGLSFTPTVLKDGIVDLIIKPEVSTIDPSHQELIGGTEVPGLITRQASTTLELRDGQTFMLGGLLQNTSTTTQDQLPWVGDVPVLGALFRSAEYQKNETDLVIIVTPHIVRPLRPTDPVHTPLDGTVPGNDIDFFLMGQAEVSPALVRLAAGALNRPYVGHILDLPKKGGVYVSAKD